MRSLRLDLHYAARQLAGSPGFTAVAVLTLALGIGATTAIFSVVDAVLLTPLPYGDPDRLVLVWNRMDKTDFPKAPVAAPDIVDYRTETTLFAGFAAMNNVAELALTGSGEPEQIKVGGVTGNFFDVLGVAPALGRTLTAEDDRPIPPEAFADPAGIPPGALVLSHGFFRRRFGGDPATVGQALRIDGRLMTIVGVMPPEFELLMPIDAGMPTDIDAWTPLEVDLAIQARDNQWLRVVARLKPGATIAAAQAEMDAVAARQRERHLFHKNMGMQIRVLPLHGDVVGHVRTVLLALAGAVGFVLAIACANVANLLLARAALRGREMAVRSALGAGRLRLVRQVLTEGLLLALLGGAAGLGLAWLGLRLLLALRPPHLPRLDEVGLDGGVLAFTLATTVAAALLFALAPALQASMAGASEVLRDRGAGTAGRGRLRNALVVAEVALSLALLIGAGLMLQSVVRLRGLEPGFEPAGALTYNVSLPFVRYGEPESRTRFLREMEAEVAALPGVEAVGAVFPLPLAGRFWTGSYGEEGTPPESWTENEASFRTITPGYFAAMGTRVLAGRALTAADLDGRREVAVIDRVLAERLWPGQPAVDRRLGIDLFGERHVLHVVGVVEHVRHDDLTRDGRPTIYFPHHLFPWPPMSVVVRAGSDPADLSAPVRRVVGGLDQELPVYAVRTLEELVGRALAVRSFTLALIAVFAGVAVALALVGLFGVLSYAVRQRTREIGIRMALGARRRAILGDVVGRGVALAGLGIGLGLLAALALTRVLAGLLYGVTATDPLTYAVLSALLVAVAALASSVPALRACRVDPTVSLRDEL